MSCPKKTLEVSLSYRKKRFQLLSAAILLSLIILLGRLAYIQILAPKMLVAEGDKRSLRKESFYPPRGTISDRNGYPLAISVPVVAVWIDPLEIERNGGVSDDLRWNAFAEILNIPIEKIKEKIKPGTKERFSYIARQVTLEKGKYIHQLRLPGIHTRKEARRFYPAGESAAQLIGITDIDQTGIEGVEKSFDLYLSGKPGERVFRKDRHGHVVENIYSVESSPAHDLALSIDVRLQDLVYKELNNAVRLNAANAGSAVLVDVNTGEILAIANSPSFNPNNISGSNKDAFRNRAITDMFEPASTVKPMIVLAALQQGIVTPDSVINTQPFHLGRHEIRDIGYYSKLTVTGILQKSSNVGVSRLSLAMPINTILDTYKKFGLDKQTNLGLAGENQGRFPSKKRWGYLERATLSYGYGIMVTPLQLARVFATFGSFGIYRPLSITKIDPPVGGDRVFPETQVKTVVHMMESVALPGGGGIKAAVKGYRVAIKTGTSKKIGNNGKYTKKYISYTAGVAPASRPRFALVIIIDEPKTGKYYGGAVSGPVFSAIMGGVLRMRNVEPDGEIKNGR